MDYDLDFTDKLSRTGTNRSNRREAVYALRIVLSHPDVLAKSMEDCEALLRVLGKNVPWPDKIHQAIIAAIQGDDETALNGGQRKDQNIPAILKSRSAWRSYENVVSEIFSEEPKLVTRFLANYLARLKPGDIQKTPGNRNTTLLGKLIGLSPIEKRVLDFAEHRNCEPFRSFLRSIDQLAARKAYTYLAAAIDAPLAEVCKALRPDAPLRGYGLVKFDGSPCDMEDFVLLAETGESFLGESFSKAEDMLRVVLQPTPAGKLAQEDYPHLAREFEWLVTYFRNVSQGRIKGGNVLFYGAPGTGKSEFARLIAQHAGLTAFDVRSADHDGNSTEAKTRLNHFALSQRFLGERDRSVVIFDEIEDVFPDSGFDFASLFGGKASGGGGEQSKAWVNHQLENSPVPAIWISNSIRAVDDAFLRRFSFHIEFRTPPKAVRERVVRRCLDNFPVSDHLVHSLAADDTLSPAQINLASRFATLCHATPGAIDESALLHAIRASQASMGRPPNTQDTRSANEACNLDFLNLDTEIPLEKIEESLCRKPSATLCFYGVPGTGKTSLAHRLADKIGRPLMVRRASDLLGKHVGESEKNIAGMFSAASQEGAVLLLDEADSFLRSRKLAAQSWEVTQTNELLQQMEAFDGIFICTTNLMDDVDEAALRRFAFKLRFDALTPAQRQAMFISMTLDGNRDGLTPAIQNSLLRLNSLVPGDFATVRRQENLIDERYSPETFLQCLERECAIKNSHPDKKFGFLG